MDLAGERFPVEERYEVRLPPGDHLIVVAVAHLGEPGYDFDHPNIAAKKSELFEFKHYRQGGSKFWTSKAGIRIYFAIPKAQIELLPEKGYGHVPVLIQGRKCRLNVRGGSGDNGWTDDIRQGADIGCGWPVSALRSLATIALHPEDCRAQGITLAIEPLKDYQRAEFVETAAAVAMRPRLGAGGRIFLRDGWSSMGSQGPFVVDSRPPRKRHFICACGTAPLRIQYAAIDWTKTAQINGVSLPGPVFVHRIGPVADRASGGIAAAAVHAALRTAHPPEAGPSADLPRRIPWD
jgi:hypothetical protein